MSSTSQVVGNSATLRRNKTARDLVSANTAGVLQAMPLNRSGAGAFSPINP